MELYKDANTSSQIISGALSGGIIGISSGITWVLLGAASTEKMLRNAKTAIETDDFITANILQAGFSEAVSLKQLKRKKSRRRSWVGLSWLSWVSLRNIEEHLLILIHISISRSRLCMLTFAPMSYTWKFLLVPFEVTHKAWSKVFIPSEERKRTIVPRWLPTKTLEQWHCFQQ